MPISLSQFGGAFLLPVVNGTFAESLTTGQVTDQVMFLQSISAMQTLNCVRSQALFTAMGSVLDNIIAIGFNSTYVNNAKTLITGLNGLSGYTNGLFGLIGSADLSILNSSNGLSFVTSMQTLLGSNYTASLRGIQYLSNSFEFLSGSLSNSEGYNIQTELAYPPSFPGGLHNFGIMLPILSQFGDNIGLQGMLDSATYLLNELNGLVVLFHVGDQSTSDGLTNFASIVAEMATEGTLLDPTITGFSGVRSMTNMIELLNTFAR